MTEDKVELGRRVGSRTNGMIQEVKGQGQGQMYKGLHWFAELDFGGCSGVQGSAEGTRVQSKFTSLPEGELGWVGVKRK